MAARMKHRGNWHHKRHKHETRACYNCNERGHLSRNCNQRSKEGRRENPFLTGNGDHKGSAQLSRSTLLLTASIGTSSSSKDSELFIMDSGASDHMVHDSSLLFNPREAATRRIVLGDGRTIDATLQGDVHVKNVLRGRANEVIRRYVVLKDALYVPGLDVNLISCSRLCEEGYTIRFGRNGCLATAEDGEVAISACKSKGLYPVQTKVDRIAAYASTAIDEKLWHARLGHANRRSVKKLLDSNAVQEFRTKSVKPLSRTHCPSCEKGKQSRVVRHANPVRAGAVGDVIHSDVCGPMSFPSFGKARYYVSFIDEFSGFICIYPIKSKSEVDGKFRTFMAWIERKGDCRIKTLHSDNGGEYVALESFLEENGIEARGSSAYSPQENGIAERANRTIVESARSMLRHAGISKQFWAEATVHAADIKNRFFCPQKQEVTSFELLMGRKPRIDNLRAFGALSWVHIPKQKRKKLDSKSEEGIVIACYETSQYKIWLRSTRTAITCRDVRIDETTFPGRNWFANEDVVVVGSDVPQHVPVQGDTQQATVEVVQQAADQLVIEPRADNHTSEVNDMVNADEDQTSPEEMDTMTYIPGTAQDQDAPSEGQEVQPRYPRRERNSPDFYNPGRAQTASSLSLPEPETYAEAMEMDEAANWDEAIQSELESLQSHGTWEIVPKHANSRILPTRFIFRRKLNSDCSLCRHKARLVVKGYLQGNVEQTFAPVVDFSTVRAILAVAVQKGLHAHQLDVRTAFLHGDIDDEIYISAPPGISICGKDQVLELRKGLYGLKQAPKLWFNKFKDVMILLGLKPLAADECVFVDDRVWLLLYVDDIIIISSSMESISAIKKKLKEQLDVKDMGPLKFFLGVAFEQDSQGAYLSQQKYLGEVLTKFGMEQCKAVKTPMSTVPSIVDSSEADRKLFQEIIGSLLFLSTRTRPDISSAVGLLCRHVSNPQHCHLITAKRILRYLRGSTDFVLRLYSSPGSLQAYADADWGNDRSDRKSTSGIVLQIGNSSVLWKSRKQPVVALSTSEAEFISASEACKAVVWLRHLLKELSCLQSGATILFEDNQGTINWATEGVRNAKHVAIRGNYVQEQIRLGSVRMQYCPGEKMTADILTKPLQRVLFEKHRTSLGVVQAAPHQVQKGS